MYKIKCDYCFETMFFETWAEKPADCKNCNSPLDHIKPELVNSELLELSSGHQEVAIRLTNQKTGEQIAIPHSETIILGRQNTGSSVFEKVPQISREHCKIEFIDGKYRITDLNSLNGTFIGPSRRDCLSHQKELLNDNTVLYLGREPFLVNINPNVVGSKSEDSNKQAAEGFQPLSFKCKACGKIHPMNLIICDECGSYGQIEPLAD